MPEMMYLARDHWSQRVGWGGSGQTNLKTALWGFSMPMLTRAALEGRTASADLARSCWGEPAPPPRYACEIRHLARSAPTRDGLLECRSAHWDTGGHTAVDLEACASIRRGGALRTSLVSAVPAATPTLQLPLAGYDLSEGWLLEE
eukprot:9503765-Pyramimonas_sp.AAC.2